MAAFRRIAVFLAAIAASFAIYMANGTGLASYDSLPSSLLPLHVLETGRLDLDEFRSSYLTALGGQYAFAEARTGHLTSAYPVGPAIVAFPLYAAFYAAAHAGGTALPPLTSPAFEPLRQQYEKTAGAIIAALAVGLFLLCARRFGNEPQALIATLVYALATSMWTTASQALWQHGPVNLFVLAMVYALLRAREAPRRSMVWLIAAGIAAGFLPVIRPTAGLFTVAGCIYAWWTFGPAARWFTAALVVGIAPVLAWNLVLFHSVTGGYGMLAAAYGAQPLHVLAALAGLLVSPSRGLFVYSPVLLFAPAGAVRAWHARRDEAPRLLLLLVAAAIGLVLQYAFFGIWWAGYAYGPRFLTDIDAVAALLIVAVIPPDPPAYFRAGMRQGLAATAFVLAFLVSAAVQFAGANAGAAATDWNAVPISVDRRPERIWQIGDNQIERTVRAVWFRYLPLAETSAPTYPQTLTEVVTAVSPGLAHVGSGAAVDVTATVANRGPARAYGYRSGIFLGQTRVRVRIADDHGRVASEQDLYVGDSPPAGQAAKALGTLQMPPAPGTYALEFDPVAVGETPPIDRGAPYRIAMNVR